jgi:transcriptional regulator
VLPPARFVTPPAHSADRSVPWATSDAPEEFMKEMLRGIVGIKFHVRDIKGAWKLDQKKSEADRTGAALGLAQNSDTSNMAQHMVAAQHAKSVQ